MNANRKLAVSALFAGLFAAAGLAQAASVDTVGAVLYWNGNTNLLADFPLDLGSVGPNDFTEPTNPNFGMFSSTTSYAPGSLSNALGSVSWTITNTSGHDITDARVVGYFEPTLGTSVDGDFIRMGSVPTTGNYMAQSVFTGYSFATFDGLPYDSFAPVSSTSYNQNCQCSIDSRAFYALALGFNLPTLKNGQSFTANFSLSSTDGVVGIVDADNNGRLLDARYLNGNVVVSAAPVPEPSEYAMLLAGLGLVGVIARRRTRG